jgi:ATP-dependent DNA helicase RecG
VDETLIDGPLGQLIRRLDEKLDAHNQVAVDITSQATETRSALYPRVALQQLTRNAIMHRAYEGTNTPVRVYWFTDRIEIYNPGGPFGSVTPENFGQPGITDYRNPNIADAMKVLGFVQRFGVGIATAQAELRKNGNPPADFQIQPSNVLAIVRKKS